jgi:hypothetical protein
MDKEIDGRHEILSTREMEDLELSYKNQELRFEDIYCQEIDRWRQIYKNQEKRKH